MGEVEVNRTILRPTAVVQGTVPMRDIPEFLGHAFIAVADVLARQGVHVTGPPLALYRSRPGDSVDVEAGFPVAVAIKPEGDVRPSIVPGGDAAETVHIGPYSTLGDAYRKLADWMERHGRRPADLSWESYLTDPDSPAGPETLVVWPITDGDRASGRRSAREDPEAVGGRTERK